MASAKPIMPMLKASCVNSYIHQATNVPIILSPMIKIKRPDKKFLNSVICKTLRGELLKVVLLLYYKCKNYAVKMACSKIVLLKW